jgi:glycosyltransferase involved in cell wall biosynthesis
VKTVDISVIVPAYNEVGNVQALADEVTAVMKKIKKEYEILFVDDGSTDGTAEKLQEMAQSDSAVRAIRFARNHGQSAALAAGFRYARGSVFVLMDADLQNDPADIPHMLAQLDTYDAVCGWRRTRQDDFVKRISSKIANAVRNWATNEQIHDTGCALKLFKRECVHNIKLYHGLHRFIPTLIKIEGYNVVEVKVNHRPRTNGISKYNIGNRLFCSLYDLVAVRWMMKRQIRFAEDVLE